MEMRCRLCAESCTNQLPVLEDMEFCSKLFHLFQIKLSLEDNLPTSVCKICFEMVGKIWEFSDRIKKAQSLLYELATNINVIFTPSESIDSQMILETQTLNTQNKLGDINCADMKPIIKSNSNVSDLCNDISDGSEKSGHQHKLLKTKGKIRKYSHTKKKFTKQSQLEAASESNFDINQDGSTTSEGELLGWNTYPWTCCDCQITFPVSDDLKAHYSSVHNSPSRYLCADCPKVYSKYNTFLLHVKLHRIKLKLCCDVCYKWFPSEAAQEQHRSHHGDDRPHACNTCEKRFTMQSALMVHARSHLPLELKNRYQCDQCPKKFSTKPNLMAHKRIHNGIREYTCDQCGKSFVQKGNLDNHLLTHTATRPFNCNVCGKAFKTLVRLRKHSSVHSGLKPHKCDICGRQFREKGTLKEHHRIHTGAMPFTCEFCGKCFRFKGVLTTHRRQHTGERPYSCNECQHHFTNWPNYNKHMKRRHGINTSVTCRTRQDIPPTGMPHRNPPGTVLAPPQPVIPENFVENQPTFYPILSLYNIPEELLQQRV